MYIDGIFFNQTKKLLEIDDHKNSRDSIHRREN